MIYVVEENGKRYQTDISPLLSPDEEEIRIALLGLISRKDNGLTQYRLFQDPQSFYSYTIGIEKRYSYIPGEIKHTQLINEEMAIPWIMEYYELSRRQTAIDIFYNIEDYFQNCFEFYFFCKDYDGNEHYIDTISEMLFGIEDIVPYTAELSYKILRILMKDYKKHMIPIEEYNEMQTRNSIEVV